MRKAIKDVCHGAAADYDTAPMINDLEIIEHLKEAFDKWTEPTDESALSEKE